MPRSQERVSGRVRTGCDSRAAVRLSLSQAGADRPPYAATEGSLGQHLHLILPPHNLPCTAGPHLGCVLPLRVRAVGGPTALPPGAVRRFRLAPQVGPIPHSCSSGNSAGLHDLSSQSLQAGLGWVGLTALGKPSRVIQPRSGCRPAAPGSPPRPSSWKAISSTNARRPALPPTQRLRHKHLGFTRRFGDAGMGGAWLASFSNPQASLDTHPLAALPFCEQEEVWRGTCELVIHEGGGVHPSLTTLSPS